MLILTVDIGTGTQDILLVDTHLDLENGYKLVVPSPTMIIYRRIKQATRRRQAVLLTGVMMGGGPSQWAAEAHLRAGLPVFATPAAARTFNDDLEAVKALGVQVVSEDEAARLPSDVLRLELRDFDFSAIAQALEAFGVTLNELAAVAVAVFDHGDSPPGYSDRQFRFDYLDRRVRQVNRLSGFAYTAENIPPILTRLKAVAASAGGIDAPLLVMDTAPAAVLGALYDSWVASQERVMAVNIGNFHTLAFRLGEGSPDSRIIEGVFEHHTGLIDLPRLETLLIRLAQGTLTHAEVFAENGHGALVYSSRPLPLGSSASPLAVTGPRRNLMRGSALHPYFAVPFGDMMLAGCIGLLSAAADHFPTLSDSIHRLLSASSSGIAPWESA